MASTGLFYVRFMDDILVLAPTRWKLRRSVATMNQVFATLRLEQHPDKTFIGKIARGFDFLGYHFSPQGLAIAEATLASFIDRTARLLEQERGRCSDPSPLGRYVRRWLAWAHGGLQPRYVGATAPESGSLNERLARSIPVSVPISAFQGRAWRNAEAHPGWVPSGREGGPAGGSRSARCWMDVGKLREHGPPRHRSPQTPNLPLMPILGAVRGSRISQT
jgi:hypothetical protein